MPEKPVFGCILIGGGISGALIRDVRLANELADRGYDVHVWWALDRQTNSGLRKSVRQYWLFHGFRYAKPVGRGFMDAVGKTLTRLFSDKKRAHGLQQRPGVLNDVMQGFLRQVYAGVETDRAVMARFTKQAREASVTHMLPMLSVLAPWALALRKTVPNPPRCLVTFQGYEVYGNYARASGTEARLYEVLKNAAMSSDYPAVAVSADYADRVTQDIGVPREHLRAIPPGIPIPPPIDKAAALDRVKRGLKGFDPALPLITFLGRRDTEKGLDLLLYATAILRRRGVQFQLAICGPTLFGNHYAEVCRQIAENLRCPVLWRKHVAEGMREALFATSRCVVYPSIHREPFGMVPVEALAHGTPAIVPDYGGVAQTIEAEGRVAGLRFRVWDSNDLAEQIERMINDQALHRRFAEAAPFVAQYYSVQKLADRILAHLGLGN